MLCAGASQEACGSRGGRTERAPVMGTAAGANAEADAASASNRPTVECIVGVYAGQAEAVLISQSFQTYAHLNIQDPRWEKNAAGMTNSTNRNECLPSNCNSSPTHPGA